MLHIGTSDNFSEPGHATSEAVMARGPNTGRIFWTCQTTARGAYNLASEVRGKAARGLDAATSVVL